MTAHVPMARVPFAPLDNPRLQHLASAKNRQNGVLAQMSGKSTTTTTTHNTSMKSSIGSNKRAYEPSTFDDFDSENVDPKLFDSPSKKTKGNVFDMVKPRPFTFSLSSPSNKTMTMPPPSAFTSRGSATPLRKTLSSPRAPSTAPAGRSPKRKLGAGRRISAPFTRVDPPAFTSSASALPFSLDAALSGSLPSSKASAGATIAESMPKNWFFEIYQDTPEEEAANLMEHSTLTLDLSSDDEDEGKKKGEYRGKENTPPEGYDAPVPSSVVEVVRRKVLSKDEMDDGARSPLSDLEAEEFFPEGLSKESIVVVEEGDGGVVKVEEKLAVEEVVEVKTVEVAADVKEEIVVWEDHDV